MTKDEETEKLEEIARLCEAAKPARTFDPTGGVEDVRIWSEKVAAVARSEKPDHALIRRLTGLAYRRALLLYGDESNFIVQKLRQANEAAFELFLDMQGKDTINIRVTFWKMHPDGRPDSHFATWDVKNRTLTNEEGVRRYPWHYSERPGSVAECYEVLESYGNDISRLRAEERLFDEREEKIVANVISCGCLAPFIIAFIYGLVSLFRSCFHLDKAAP